MTNAEKRNLAKALTHLFLIQSAKPVSVEEYSRQYKIFKKLLEAR